MKTGNASFFEAVLVALGSLRGSKLRTFLTLLGIILATTTLIAVMSVIRGMDVYIAENVADMGVEGFRVQRIIMIGEFNPKKYLEMNRKNPQLSRAEFDFIKERAKLIREVGVSVNRASAATYGGVNAGDGRASFGILVGATFDRISAPSALTAGWHHLAGVRSGTTLRLYVDGVEVASTTTGITRALQPNDGLVIGRSSTYPSLANPAYFKGLVDETALYNRALTAAEIAAINSYAGGGKAGNLIQGNRIGTNAAGDAAIGNGGDGIRIDGGASEITVGGNVAGARNLISGNTGSGVALDGVGTLGNTIAGNSVGTNAAGSGAIGNAGSGIRISGGAKSNTIGSNGDGTNDAAEQNVISGNAGASKAGVEITGSKRTRSCSK